MGDLDVLMADREVILLGGSQGSGKSFSVAKLVEQGVKEDFNVSIIDRDRGMSKALREVFGKKLPGNLEYYLITEWDKIYEAVAESFNLLGADDWLVFEHCGRLWDMAQNDFAEKTYGGLTAHLLKARVDAEDEVRARDLDPKTATKERASKIGFGGMEGRYDWPLIKRMHNNEVFDKVSIEGVFNILTTTSLTPLQDTDLKQGRWTDFHKLGSRPEGEKHQVYRHDTVAISYQREGKFLWRTDLGAGSGKDRGRTLHRDVDFSQTGFIESYVGSIQDA